MLRCNCNRQYCLLRPPCRPHPTHSIRANRTHYFPLSTTTHRTKPWSWICLPFQPHYLLHSLRQSLMHLHTAFQAHQEFQHHPSSIQATDSKISRLRQTHSTLHLLLRQAHSLQHCPIPRATFTNSININSFIPTTPLIPKCPSKATLWTQE